MPWTTPKTWVDNVDALSATNLNTHLRDNLSQMTTWATYTPTWAATGGTPALGNGTLSGRYIKAGSLCHVTIALTIGSTTTFGTTTNWTFTLPATCTQRSLLTAELDDAGTIVRMGTVTLVAGATATGLVWTTSGSSVGYNHPHSWGTSDVLVISGTYEC